MIVTLMPSVTEPDLTDTWTTDSSSALINCAGLLRFAELHCARLASDSIQPNQSVAVDAKLTMMQCKNAIHCIAVRCEEVRRCVLGDDARCLPMLEACQI